MNNIETMEKEMLNFCCASGKDPRYGVVRATADFPDTYTAGWNGMPVPDAPFDILTKNIDRTFFPVNGYGAGFEDREWYMDESMMYQNLIPEVKEECGARPLPFTKKKKEWLECREKVEGRMGEQAKLEQQIKERIAAGTDTTTQAGIKTGTIVAIGIGAVVLLGIGTWLLIKKRKK